MIGPVVDCSITVSWCFKDQADPLADRVLDDVSRIGAVVPAIWPLELANALLISERRKKISEAELTRLLVFIGSLPIVVDEEAPRRALGPILSIGRERIISSYDAAYVELAMRLGRPLATRDEGMKKAARALGVPLV